MVEAADLTEAEREAVHEVEAGTEWIRRAHGLLVQFHHAVGHAMDHYGDARHALAEEHPELATLFESEVLPAGVTEEGHLSYQLVAEFEEDFLAAVEDATDETREELVSGERYVVEAARHAEAGTPAADGRPSDDGGDER